MKDWRRLQRWGGSFLLDKCCHDFDVYRLFVGSRPARVASFGRRAIFTEENAGLAARAYGDGRRAYEGWAGRWEGGTRVFNSDADVNDVQVAILDYENCATLAFHCNSHAGFHQRRWHIVGTEASLAVDLYKGRIVIGDPIGRGRAEKFDFAADASDDAHGAADPAMARDIAARVFVNKPFPVTAYDALVAGLTVMAVDRAAASGTVIDCRTMWDTLDAAYRGH
jgi:predicted dehydrogenase